MVGVRGGEVEWETGEGGGVGLGWGELRVLDQRPASRTGREMVEGEVEQGASWREETWLRWDGTSRCLGFKPGRDAMRERTEAETPGRTVSLGRCCNLLEHKMPSIPQETGQIAI